MNIKNRDLIRELLRRLPIGWVNMSSRTYNRVRVAWIIPGGSYFITVANELDYINYSCGKKIDGVLIDTFSTSSLELMIDYVKEVVN